MKIVHARVEPQTQVRGVSAPKYHAVVRVSSDGAEGEASADYDDPSQALMCAFDAAFAHMLAQLRESLQIHISVDF